MLAPWVEDGFHAPAKAGALTVMVGVYAFAIQIYGDFLGYSSIARGLGLLMGVRLMHNFQMPYLATNPSDFWRRWHISLSNWLRDYLYISLGGSRASTLRTYSNLMITMVLGGLWHGAAWHYIAWGAYHGGLLVVHRAVSTSSFLARIPRWLKIGAFFQLTCVGWILFRVETLADAPQVLKSFFLGWRDVAGASTGQWRVWFLAAVITSPIVLVDLLRERSNEMNVFERWSVPSKIAAATVMFGLIVLSGVVGGAQFIYFQF